MKFKFNIALLFVFAAFVYSCSDDELANYGTETEVARDEVFIETLIATQVIPFTAGDPDYGLEFRLTTPDRVVSSVNIYKTFNSKGSSSNEALLRSYTISTDVNTQVVTDRFTYADLKDGLTIDGGPLTDDQNLLPVGATWDLRIEGLDSAGNPIHDGGSMTVGVLSRFAGLYEVIESDYYRIGVQSGGADWTGTEIFIGSVNATTFSHNGYWGPFAAEGFFEFVLNEDDNTIAIPKEPEDGHIQLFFSGDALLNCEDDGASFVNVACEGSNILIPSDEDGKHIIKLTYGYFTASGDENEGPREFSETLRKIVQ